MQFFILFLTATFSSMVFVAVLMRVAEPLRFVDVPDFRKQHTKIIPRVGGIGMVMGVALALLLWGKPDSMTLSLLGGIGVLTVFGVLDDRFSLDYRLKFLGQFIAILIPVLHGDLVIRSVGIFGWSSLPDLVAYPLTVVFILGTTNAVNLSDGLDGLAAGLGVLSLVAIAYLAAIVDGEPVIAVCVAIIGSTLGFLRYNTHPAVVFMGDTGSQFLGFTAGLLAVFVTQQVNPLVSAILPLFILGLPVVDTVRVMIERIRNGVSPFKPDRRHFHHRLLELGFDHYEAVVVIYVIQAAFLVLTFLLRYESDLLALAIYVAYFGCLWFFFPIAVRMGWQRPRRKTGEASALRRAIDTAARRHWLERAADIALSLVVPGLLAWVAWRFHSASSDLGLFSAGILALWLAAGIGRLESFALIDRVALYSSVTLVFYLIGSAQGVHPDMEHFVRMGVLLIAVLVGLGVGFSATHFRVTPSDFLVMFVLLTAASLPGLGKISYASLATEAAVVLYAVEFLLRRRGKGVLLLRGVIMLMFAAIAVRTLVLGQTNPPTGSPPAAESQALPKIDETPVLDPFLERR